MKKDIRAWRSQYAGELLDETLVASHPLTQFDTWFQEAVSAAVIEPHAMVLATANENGLPSARVVLLKAFDEEGFTFYTNYNSHKGKDLETNPQASLLFFWPQLHRQVRISGEVLKTSREDSEAYFSERPRESRISAWVSPQSSVVASRAALEEKHKTLEAEYSGRDIPFPDFWGGYCLKPTVFEFWQGQANRLHDRVLYSLEAATDTWKIERLAP